MRGKKDLTVYIRVAVGMGITIWIPIPTGLGWEWDFSLWGSTYGSPYRYPYGDPHRGKSYSHSHRYGYPYGDIRMGISIWIPMGIPTEILWEWDGNGNGNSLPTATLVYILLEKVRNTLLKKVRTDPVCVLSRVCMCANRVLLYAHRDYLNNQCSRLRLIGPNGR